MRRLLTLLSFCLALPAFAEDAQPAKPKDLQPLPAPPAMADQPDLEPQVTIVQRGKEKIEEHRVNGRLYMIKVTPPIGAPYYLVDYRGDGKFARQDNLDAGIRVPMWVIFSF